MLYEVITVVETAGSELHILHDGELRLAALPALVDDKLARGASGNLFTEIVFDEREGEVSYNFV